MTVASIVVPCHNSEKYLGEALDSALSQTEQDIEIICVDNASTDGTYDLLEEYARVDSRISVIREPEVGEGFAKDAGLKAAHGDWLFILDSDDIMAPTLIEKAVAAGESGEADIVVFRVQELDDITGEVRPCPKSFSIGWLPEDVVLFNPRCYPFRIFNSFQNWMQNKLFRARFINEKGITVQRQPRIADFFFTNLALSEARLIRPLDCTLYTYRVNNAGSAVRTSYRYPLDFYRARLALREELEKRGTWGLYRDSFVNSAMEGVGMSLYFANSYETFRFIAETMKSEGLEALDIMGFPEEKSYSWLHYEQCKRLAEDEVEDLLFYYLFLEKEHVKNTENEASQLRIELRETRVALSEIEQSRSYQLGNAAAMPFRAFRNLVHR